MNSTLPTISTYRILMSNFLASVDIKDLVTHTATHLLLIIFLSHLSIRVADTHIYTYTYYCIVNASMSKHVYYNTVIILQYKPKKPYRF